MLFIEGKRTDALSASTRWFTQRSQLWRNVETASEFAAGKDFALILAVEEAQHGREVLRLAPETLEASYPHLARAQREELSEHFLGFVTWLRIVEAFELPTSCLIERLG